MIKPKHWIRKSELRLYYEVYGEEDESFEDYVIRWSESMNDIGFPHKIIEDGAWEQNDYYIGNDFEDEK